MVISLNQLQSVFTNNTDITNDAVFPLRFATKDKLWRRKNYDLQLLIEMLRHNIELKFIWNSSKKSLEFFWQYKSSKVTLQGTQKWVFRNLKSSFFSNPDMYLLTTKRRQELQPLQQQQQQQQQQSRNFDRSLVL